MLFFLNKFFKKIITSHILLGLGLIYLYYFGKFYLSDITLNDLFYLSFTYPTDPRNLTILVDAFYLFWDKFLVPNILLYTIDFFFLKIFGFDNLWITALIYKTILYFILTINLKKIFLLKDNYFLILIFAIVISLCSSYELFADRFIRNQITIIIYSLIFINLYLLETKEKNKSIFILGGCTALLLSSDPWSLLFLIGLYLINLRIILKRLYLFLIPFLVLSLPFFYVFFSQQIYNYSNSDYLGSKFIFDKTTFYFDYLIELFKSKRIVTLLIFNLIVNFYNNNNYKSLILLALLTLSPVLLIITNYTIQSYHLLQGAFNLTVFFTYFCFFEMLKVGKSSYLNIYNNSTKIIFFILSAIFIIFFIFLNNKWFDRALEVKNSYKKNFSIIRNLDLNCVIISNDDYIRGYASILKKNKIIPIEGVIRNSSLTDVIKEVNFLISFLEVSDKKIMTDFYWSATHALFYNTRSTNSKLVTYSLEDKEIKLKKINSMAGFTITVPDKYLDYKINEYINLNKTDYIKFRKDLENFIYLDNNKVLKASLSCLPS